MILGKTKLYLYGTSIMRVQFKILLPKLKFQMLICRVIPETAHAAFDKVMYVCLLYALQTKCVC